MPILNSRSTYGRVAQCLHWLTAALILTMLGLGLWMEDLPQESQADLSRVAFVYSLHKTLGIATLIVVLVRIGWAIGNVHPGLLNADRRLEAFAAGAVHWVLYGAILLMPISGWLYHAAHAGGAPIWWPPGLGFGQDLPLIPKSHVLAEFFDTVHASLGWVIIAAVALHVAGALKHTVIDRDGTLQRMLPFGRSPATDPPAAQPSAAAPFGTAAVIFIAVLAIAAWTGFSGAGQKDGAPAGSATSAAGGNWAVDPANSRLGIEVQLMGSTVAGQFDSWSAEIQFDPADLAASRVGVDVDTGSLGLGDVTEQAHSPAYLDAAGHPTARFETSTIRHIGEGRYEAVGELTLRGVTAPVTLPFDLAIEGDTARMTGRAQVDRMTFDIGADALPQEDTLGFPVDIVVEVAATRR